MWHHVSTKPVADGGRGPKELTGMVDLTRDATGRVRARLLDLVPGRSSKAYADWIKERDEQFRAGVKIAALDPFAGYKKALDDELDDAIAEIVDSLLKGGPHAQAECKSLLRAVAGQPIDEATVEETVQRMTRVRMSDEGVEGLNAFVEKRKPNWIA